MDIGIRDVPARAVNVPLEYPIRTAVGTVAGRLQGGASLPRTEALFRICRERHLEIKPVIEYRWTSYCFPLSV